MEVTLHYESIIIEWNMGTKTGGSGLAVESTGTWIRSCRPSGCKKMKDPYLGLNEYAARNLLMHDYSYECTFDVEDAILLSDRAELVFMVWTRLQIFI